MSSAELEALLNEHGVPNGKIFTAPDMLADAHFAARDAVVKLAHPQLGEFAMQNVVPKLSDTPGEIRWVGPELGEHLDGGRDTEGEVDVDGVRQDGSVEPVMRKGAWV